MSKWDKLRDIRDHKVIQNKTQNVYEDKQKGNNLTYNKHKLLKRDETTKKETKNNYKEAYITTK